MPTITLNMPPVAQKRHRDIDPSKRIISNRTGKRVFKFNPNKQELQDYRLLILLALRQIRITKPYNGPISIDLYFHLPKPKKGPPIQNGAFCAKRPDIDNYIKFVMDALNGVLYEDDCQVCMLGAQKVYDDHPKTIINFIEL